MKRWMHDSTTETDIAAAEQRQPSRKLKRTPESGHSYDSPVTFNNIDEYKQWWKDDELYED